MEENGEELQLPIANVGRLKKKMLPQRARVSKEAKEIMQECATELVSFLTSEAAETCHRENRRTLNGDDSYWAFGVLGLDNYVETSFKYLLKYREVERIKTSNKNIRTRVGEEEDNDDNNEFYLGESSRPN